MAHIQLYVSKSQRGFKNLVKINASEDVFCHIHDLSPALEILRFNEGRPEQVYLVSYLSEGLLFSILQPLSGEGHDNFCATFYIEEGLLLDIETFKAMLESASSLLALQTEPTEEGLAPLRLLLSKDYGKAETVARHYPSTGHNYAYARFGGSNSPSLESYFGEHFYQPGFSSYAGVVLLNERENIEASRHANDLTCNPLKHIVVVTPPTATSTGFAPLIGRRPFDAPLLAAEGSSVDIEWRRSGFEPVRESFVVPKGGGTPPVPDTLEARRVISPSTFYITEQGSQRSVGAYRIKVNNVEIDGPVAFSYTELKEARVEISSPGYFAFSEIVDLASSSQALIQMRALHMTYRFDLPLMTAESVGHIRIYLKTKNKLTRCPIEGYAVAGDGVIEGSGVTNKLVYVGGKSRYAILKLILYVLASMLVGLMAGRYIFPNESNRHARLSAEQFAAPVQAAPSAVEAPAVQPVEDAPVAIDTIVDLDAAAAYLQANQNWKREVMEEIAGLSGLYDDLNNYNYERLKNHWGPKLGGKSSNFDAVLRAVDGAQFKRDPREGLHKPCFAPSQPAIINWRSYTYWIDP